MIEIHSFTFNPFQENTYLLINEKKDCIIIDPGFYFEEERKEFLDFIHTAKLNPVRLLNTHGHLDHIFGNHLVNREFALTPEIHQLEQEILDHSPQAALLYQVPFDPSPSPKNYLSHGDRLIFGEDQLEVIFTPGHSPGSISFFCREQGFICSGDVLFWKSIGRTDLPGGDAKTLLNSIYQKLFPLGPEVVVYSGHGPVTSLGQEKKHNPFLQG
ncbi:MAG: MBL fold metallo-hydrolase [Chitinophagaceae bacterium]